MKNHKGLRLNRMIFMLVALFFSFAVFTSLYAQEQKQTPDQKTETVAATGTDVPEDRPYDVLEPEFRKIGPGFGGMNAVPFWVSVVMFLIAMVVLFKTKNKAVRALAGLASLAALGVISYITYWEARALGRQHGYAPVQPIWFSHKVHVTQNNIDCEYCHTDARESRHAGIPSLSVCMNCHSVVKEGEISGTKEIAKIYEHLGYNPQTQQYDKPGKPIQWIKVHNLPDHVYFNHAQHVEAGKVQCQECHGPVERMNRVVDYTELSMKFCLDCHREREIITENEYYSLYKFHLKPGEKPKVKHIGGQDCSACHY
ncbi:MAG: cytochrome c3 family protein [Chlorobi bacterium]|nr:cytochrome c3 family protein [Chlorobiota bacterium]